MANPTLNENTFNTIETGVLDAPMTVSGTCLKTLFLLLFVCLAGTYSWTHMQYSSILMMGGVIVGFILALVISFKPKTASYLSPIYAIAEGLALGAISGLFDAEFQGIVVQAVLGTFATLFTMLALYMSKAIVVTEKLRSVVFAATVTVAVMYLIAFVLGLFHVALPFLYDSSPMSIGISIVVIAIAAFNLLLDFDIIDRGVMSNAPKYYEWYCGFGLLVTLVWLYLEILKLLAKLNRRN